MNRLSLAIAIAAAAAIGILWSWPVAISIVAAVLIFGAVRRWQQSVNARSMGVALAIDILRSGAFLIPFALALYQRVWIAAVAVVCVYLLILMTAPHSREV